MAELKRLKLIDNQCKAWGNLSESIKLSLNSFSNPSPPSNEFPIDEDGAGIVDEEKK